MPTVTQMSDQALLALVVGSPNVAENLLEENRSLTNLLCASSYSDECYRVAEPAIPSGWSDAHLKLNAARELVRRGLEEGLQARDCFSSPGAVRDYLRTAIAPLQHEVFYVLYLDTQHRLIAAREEFRGTLTQTPVYPREIVKRALSYNTCSCVVLAHNHPSCVGEPSHADKVLTQQLKSALALVDIRVLDHFIVAGPRVTSMAELGLI